MLSVQVGESPAVITATRIRPFRRLVSELEQDIVAGLGLGDWRVAPFAVEVRLVPNLDRLDLPEVGRAGVAAHEGVDEVRVVLVVIGAVVGVVLPGPAGLKSMRAMILTPALRESTTMRSASSHLNWPSPARSPATGTATSAR